MLRSLIYSNRTITYSAKPFYIIQKDISKNDIFFEVLNSISYSIAHCYLMYGASLFVTKNVEKIAHIHWLVIYCSYKAFLFRTSSSLTCVSCFNYNYRGNTFRTGNLDFCYIMM